MAYLSMPFCASQSSPEQNENVWVWIVVGGLSSFHFLNATPIKIWLFFSKYFVHWLLGWIRIVSALFFPFYSGTIKLDKKWDGSIVGKMFVICSLVVLQFMRFLLQLPPLSGRVLFSSQFVFYFSFFPQCQCNSVSFFIADINLAIHFEQLNWANANTEYK